MAELVVLGSGTGLPSLRRGSPALLLITENSKILIDSGPGTLRRMLEAGVTYQDIDLLLFTHTHPDHTADLIPFLFACKYPGEPREKDLLCLGGAGFGSHFEKLTGVYGSWIEAQTYQRTVTEIPEGPFPFRDVVVRSKPVAHIPESVGYRIDLKNGKTIALSGDTDYCRNIVDLGFETDLLILESSFPDSQKVEGHLTPSLAGRIGTEARCKTLVLTHLYPPCDQVDILEQCKRIYKGKLIVAEDLMRIKIS
jgi:ribonuclease BN (tRNA processing enzyme)